MLGPENGIMSPPLKGRHTDFGSVIVVVFVIVCVIPF